MKKWTIIALVLFFAIYLYPSQQKGYDSANYSDGKFHNLTEHERSRMYIFGKVYRILFASDSLTPKTNPPEAKISSAYFRSYTHGHLQAVWAGHSSVLLKFNDIKILTDPVFSERVSPISFIGPKRFEKSNPLDGVDTGKIDAVIISHNHFDHLDKKAVMQLKDRVGMFVVSLGVGQYLKEWGVDPLRIVELDWGQSISMRGIRITAAPANHMSGRGFFDRNKTFWSSFVINAGPYNVFFTGDTGYMKAFRNIGQYYGPFDLVLADIGAYNPAWKYNHMTPEEALKAFHDLNGKIIMPIHWGTFQLSDFNWKEPIDRFTTEAKKERVKYAVPIQGEPIDIAGAMPTDDWWSSVK